jgi:hypothetical protein
MEDIKVGDILITWRFRGQGSDYISMDKVIYVDFKKLLNRIESDYCFMGHNDIIRWDKTFIPGTSNYCKLEDIDLYSELEEYKIVIDKLKIAFYKKHKEYSRKIKLNKIKL